MKKFTVSVLSFLAIVMLCAFGMSCKDKTETDFSVVNGVYSAQTATGEYRMTINGASFVWKTDSEQVGIVSFEDGKWFFKFDAGKNNAEATFENNMLAFTYAGKNYSLYKEIEFTVSFVADGKTETQTVINGRRATKPADPEKSGFAFVGWYNTSDYKTLYDFNTVITGDKTVYGRFTEASSDNREYSASFYDGKGNLAFMRTTTGGRLFDVSELSVSGKTFVGWWISDYQDKEKLTCKYEGEVLNANTNFYAVYAEDNALAPSVKNGRISWTSAGVNKNYSIAIIAPDGTKTTSNTGSTKYDYDFSKAKAGDYTAEITVDGKTYRAYYKNKALARVSEFRLADTFVLSFTPVEHAEKYYITVKCGNSEHNHTRVDNGASTYYNFINCEMSSLGISFVVEAEASGYANSVSDEFVVKRDLTSAEGLTVNAETDELRWKAVQNATNYVLEITASGSTETVSVGNTTKYSLKTYNRGSITIKVTAKARGYNSAEAATVTYDKKHIATPEDVKIAGKTVTFKAVDGAKSYVVKTGNTTKTVAGGTGTITFTLSDDCFANGDGLYAVSVKAVADKPENDSVYSDETLIIVGDNISTTATVNYEKGKLSWTSVANAKGYKVFVNGEEVVSISADKSECELTFTSDGQNNIEVFYLNARGDRKTLASASVTVYAVSFNANGGSPVQTLYLVTGDELTLPETTYRGYEFLGWYNAPSEQAGIKYEDGIFEDENDVTLYAAWKTKEYKVDFNLGGVEDETVTETTVAFGSAYTVCVPGIEANPDKTKRFGGWFSLPNGEGTRYTDELGRSYGVWDYDEDGRTFYAVWYTAFEFYEIDNATAYSVTGGMEASLFVSLTIPSTYNGKPVTTVEGSAFRGCTGLEEVNIPDTIKLIETGTAFTSCTSLKNVNIIATESKDKGLYSSIDGVLFYANEYNGFEIKFFPTGRTGEYVIPDEVETIPVGVFKNSKISGVVIPANVTSINSQAFYYSRNLTRVAFEKTPAGKEEKALAISADAFKSCTALTEITLPSRISSFDGKMFYLCNSLAKVNIDGAGGEYTSKDGVVCNKDGTTIIYCPAGRTGKYTIPSGVGSVGESAFASVRITSLEVPGYVSEIGKEAFRSCYYLRQIDFTGVENDMDLKIGESAFYGCTALKSLTLPVNLVELGAHAFGGISALTEVTVNSGKVNFANAAFGTAETSPRYYVQRLNIGAKLELIDINGVFGGLVLDVVNVDERNPNYTVVDGVIFDKSVTAIVYYPNGKTGDYVLPETIAKIGANVFANKSLKKITIGANIVEIGSGAFENCKYLTDVVFEAGDKPLTIGDNAFAGSAIISANLPARAVALGSGAFANCIKLVSVTVPAGVKEIKQDAFNGCEKLFSVTIKEGITSIEVGAFANCASLVSVSLPSTVVTLGTEEGLMTVFSMCPSLETVTIADGNAKYTTLGGVIYEKNEQGKLVSLVYCPIQNTTADGTYTVPGSVEYVFAGAFASNNGIAKVAFASSENGIQFGKKVFDGCTGLTEVVLPSGITVIVESLFENCSSLESIVIPNTVTSIELSAFRMCSSLSSVIFENGGTEELKLADGKQAGTPPSYSGIFSGCISLKTLTLPERTTYIGNYAFSITDNTGDPQDDSRQTGLTVLNLPATLKTIGIGAFQYSNYLTTVNIASGSKLETISNNAFQYCYVLDAINLPASLKTIGNNAFANAKLLKEVTFGENSQLTSIGTGAFNGCLDLKSIEIPASVKTIGNNAFKNAKRLASVTFEEGSEITSIGNNAFDSTAITEFSFPETTGSLTAGNSLFNACVKLKKVYISKNVTNLAKAFNSCGSITEITVSADHASAKVTDNMLTSTDGRNIYYVLPGAESSTFKVANGVEIIGSYAFANKDDITKIVIPASVKTIDTYAFSGCTALEEIEFESGSELSKINNYAFNNCSSLKSITLPKAVTSLGTYVFAGCSSLTSVEFGSSFKTLGQNDFRNCTSLKSITLPAGVTALPNYLFYGCSALTDVKFKGIVTTIGNFCFQNCTSLVSFEIPESVKKLGSPTLNKQGYVSGSGGVFKGCTSLKTVKLPSSMTAIAPEMFKGCSALETIEIPKTMKAIGYSVFEGCESLNNIKIPAGVVLGGSLNSPTSNCAVFKNCTSLSNITFESDIVMVGKEMFYGCKSLKSFNAKGYTIIGNNAFAGSGLESFIIPSGVVNVAQGAFSDCVNLGNVTIPASVKTIGTRVFSGCTSLSLTLDASNSYFYEENGMIINGTNDTLVFIPSDVTGEIVIPEGIIISDYAFEGAYGVTGISLAYSVATKINKYAFYNCASLEEVVLPETVTAIEQNAFDGCASLTSVNIPASVVSIGARAFNGCTSLTGIIIPETVTSVGQAAFYEATGLKNVVWSSAAATVPNMAFQGCETLESVTLPEGVTAISANAFNGCAALTSITLPSTLKTIESKAFAYSGLTRVVIPAGVTSISGGAFLGCDISELVFEKGNEEFTTDEKGMVYNKKRELIYCPNTVVGEIVLEKGFSLGSYAFENCKNVTKIVLPEGLKKIPEGAFFGCASLTSIVIPDSVTTLGASVFEGCAALSSVTFGSGLISLTASMFKGCTALSSVTLHDGITKVAATTFDGCVLEVKVPYENESKLPSGLAKLAAMEGVSVVYLG